MERLRPLRAYGLQKRELYLDCDALVYFLYRLFFFLDVDDVVLFWSNWPLESSGFEKFGFGILFKTLCFIAPNEVWQTKNEN